MMRPVMLYLPLITLLAIGVYALFFFDKPMKRLFISADAEAAALEEKGQIDAALALYEDPLLKGALYYKQAEFEKALDMYRLLDTKEGFFNRANALVMLGKYNEAIENYALVLSVEPTNRFAKENMALARLRQAALDRYKNSDAGATNIGADKVVYDNTQNRGDTITASSATDASESAQWLDRLQTSPKGFLAAKFRYQYDRAKKVQP